MPSYRRGGDHRLQPSEDYFLDHDHTHNYNLLSLSESAYSKVQITHDLYLAQLATNYN